MQTCTHCHRDLPLKEYYGHPRMANGHYSYCKACHKAAILRARERDPARYKAMYAANLAVRNGKLLKQPCKICGSLNVRAYHADYSKPLDVEWVCFPHYREIVYKRSHPTDPT